VRRASEKWQSEGVAAHYASERFRSARARGRDLHLVERLLDRHAPRSERLLDVPSGTGRLAAGLAARAGSYVGCDVSPAMLACFTATRVAADAGRLPFADDSFDVVVCCRLLHHLPPGGPLEGVTSELVRVSRGLVIASFWDAGSWPGLRRTRGWRRDETGRRPLARHDLELAFANSGGDVVDYAASLRFVSMQTFAAVRKER
jgi:SAM-dependent methyltransferase